jgi:hypothetical protein
MENKTDCEKCAACIKREGHTYAGCLVLGRINKGLFVTHCRQFKVAYSQFQAFLGLLRLIWYANVVFKGC